MLSRTARFCLRAIFRAKFCFSCEYFSKTMPLTRRSKRLRDAVEDVTSGIPKKPRLNPVSFYGKALDEVENGDRSSGKKRAKSQPIKKKSLNLRNMNIPQGNKTKEEQVPDATSPENEESDENHEEEDLPEDYDYEEWRMKNIEENAKFFASLGIFKARDDLKLNGNAIKKPMASQRGLKREPRPKEVLPRREPSLRIRNMNPEGLPLPERVVPAVTPEDSRRERKPSGSIDMKATNQKEGDEHVSRAFLNSWKASYNSPNKQKDHSLPLDSFLGQAAKMRLRPEHVAKVTKDRIFSVAVHPSPTKELVCAGDKWGRLGLWDLGSKSGDEGVHLFEPHSRPLTCLHFLPHDSSKLYSSSYDGTIRRAHFNKEVFEEVYATTYGDDVWITYFDLLSPDGSTLAVTQNINRVGCLAIVDTRSPKGTVQSNFHVHDKVAKTVSVHPLNKNYVVTASTDATVAIWDIRGMKEKGKSKSVASIPHGRSLSSAFFSPLTGSKIVTTSFDDRIRIINCKSSELITAAEVTNSIRHNNHTGRWLTPFRAVWHPSREDLFFCGSMVQPRQIEMYSAESGLIHSFKDENLGSVCSLVAFHPAKNKNMLVGGNSSGRMHLFM